MSIIKNVLLLTDPQSDFLQQTIWKGLVKILGSEHVITMPTIQHFYGGVDNWYILDDGKRGLTEAPKHLIAESDPGWTQEQILEHLGDFDLMILCSARRYALAALDTIRQQSMPKPPLVALCGEDYSWAPINEEIISRYRPKAFFKRELDRQIEGVYPLPFGAFIDSYPEVDDSQKTYSVFASFGITWPSRMELLKRLEAMRLPNAILATNTDQIPEGSTLRPMLGYEDYLRAIAQSKITFVMRGFGRTTLRDWEAPAWKTCVFWSDPGTIIPHPFQDGIHVVKYNESLDGLEQRIEYYLTHDEEREAIALAGKTHTLKYHTVESRAAYLLEISERVIAKSKHHILV